jgi:hypothetical protein
MAPRRPRSAPSPGGEAPRRRRSGPSGRSSPESALASRKVRVDRETLADIEAAAEREGTSAGAQIARAWEAWEAWRATK